MTVATLSPQRAHPARRKACAVDPFKLSPPIGAALAFLGVERSLPLLHGSAGCASTAVTFLVRHFREPVLIRTVALDEISAILGGFGDLERALLDAAREEAPALVGLVTTGAIEARGEDVRAALVRLREKHASSPGFAAMEVLAVPTPDFVGGFQEGWARAVEGLVEGLVRPAPERNPRQVNILAGSHLSLGDLEALRELVESFGLTPIILPDLSRAFGGPLEEEGAPIAHGGTPLEALYAMGASCSTLAFGEHLRPAAARLQALADVPYQVFDRVLGLASCDALVAALARISKSEVPPWIRRQRGQLIDAMMEASPIFSGKKAALAAEPDLLFDLSGWLTELGAQITAAVASAPTSALDAVPAGEVVIGDLEDLEARAGGADLLVASSNAARVAERLGLPLWRVGLPISDRLGGSHRVSLGYRGNRATLFEVGNLFLETARAPRS